MVICLEQGADLHMAQLMPLPLTVSCFTKIQIGFTILVPAHPGSPRKRADKWVCVCVCVSGVYTRNRNFRLLSSTKLGKSSGELKVARENQFHHRSSGGDGSPAKHSRLRQRAKTERDHHSSMEQTFLDSLICNVEYVVHLSSSLL